MKPSATSAELDAARRYHHLLTKHGRGVVDPLTIRPLAAFGRQRLLDWGETVTVAVVEALRRCGRPGTRN